MAIDIATDPAQSARAAGLRYVTDAVPGIRRRRAGRSFRYIAPDGSAVRDPETIHRIKSLAIPPAWTDVWISPTPRGHIQATGRDARGRKQYRYHPRWREVRDEAKYERTVLFGEMLPAIRERLSQDLGLRGLPRDKVLATVVQLLDETAIRIGNEEYARENHSFGLTTMRNRHVDVEGSTLHFHYRGKSGKEHVVDVRDRRVARVVKHCQDIPGQELFQYLDDEGQRRTVDSDDVNAYIRDIAGYDFSAKDFRTWHGTVFAAQALYDLGGFDSATQAKKNLGQAIEFAAKRLGNTKTICRTCYVHPIVIDSYLDESLLSLWTVPAMTAGLRPEEAATLSLLRNHSAQERGRDAIPA